MVAKRIPKPKEIAMGIMNLACLEVSKIIGASPPKVVKVVSNTGLKRLRPANFIASKECFPFPRHHC